MLKEEEEKIIKLLYIVEIQVCKRTVRTFHRLSRVFVENSKLKNKYKSENISHV